jgi:hypothetical protein
MVKNKNFFIFAENSDWTYPIPENNFGAISILKQNRTILSKTEVVFKSFLNNFIFISFINSKKYKNLKA